MVEDIDDFLNLNDNGEVSSVQNKIQNKSPIESNKNQKEEKYQDSNFFQESDNDLPQLCGNGYPPEFVQIVDRVYITYKILPKLEYAKIYRELADLSITSAPTPTLQVLNDEIQRVQGAKDRLSEIMIKVLECHNIKRRLVDTLITAWGKFSSEKNAESRKGDGVFRLSHFSIDLAKVESLLKVCSHILKNLDSLHDSLSRRITINQLLLKMNDMGRGSLPDYNFKREDMELNESDLFGKNKDIDPSESINPSEETW